MSPLSEIEMSPFRRDCEWYRKAAEGDDKVSALLIMSQTELTRLDAMQQLQTKSATQTQIAHRLDLSVRQVKRLWRGYL